MKLKIGMQVFFGGIWRFGSAVDDVVRWNGLVRVLSFDEETVAAYVENTVPTINFCRYDEIFETREEAEAASKANFR